MNREIKFRAWDKKEKVMCKVGVINLEKGCFLLGNSPTPEQRITDKMFIASVAEGHFVYFEDLVLMQYTGLKDKNGKEVYEGDYDADYNVVRWCEERNGWAFACYDVPTKEFIHCHCYRCEGNFEIDETPFEIIGNLYENPELLTT